MFRSSETIGMIASALARAQAEIVNPEKLLVATLRAPNPWEADKTFRYAGLSSGLNMSFTILLIVVTTPCWSS